jgi:5-methylcytosine-specific restriction endonuclease McrA
MGNCISNKNSCVKPNAITSSSTNKTVIVKLKKGFVKNKTYRKKSIPKSLKKQTWDKWVGASIGATKCLCCEHEEIRQIEFHCGHIIAEADGGSTTVDNLLPICAQCNLSMGKMNLYEFKKEYFSNR